MGINTLNDKSVVASLRRETDDLRKEMEALRASLRTIRKMASLDQLKVFDIFIIADEALREGPYGEGS